eukprot:JP446788.1.p1 GENE.JP446788.1~~JP446788.1.p1  ORF type:complete len:255 (-),score=54.08 JP446788.1:48-812(-)
MADKQHALVIGANRGLGLELVKALQQRGLRVTGTTRKDSDALTATGAKVISGIDLEDDNSGKLLVEKLAGDKVDVLWCSAGYFFTGETFDVLNWEEQRKMYEICAIAPLRITQALVTGNLVCSGAKVILITSEGGSIGLRSFEEGGGHYGHHCSKAAENMMGRLMAFDLKPRGIAVQMQHPGFLRTEMTAHYAHFYDEFGAVPASEAVPKLIDCANALTLETTGRFIAPLGANGLGLGAKQLPAGFQPGDGIPW